METYAKIGNSLQVTSPVVYAYDGLITEKKMLEAAIAQSQAQLAKINALIAEAEKLGLTKG